MAVGIRANFYLMVRDRGVASGGGATTPPPPGGWAFCRFYGLAGNTIALLHLFKTSLPQTAPPPLAKPWLRHWSEILYHTRLAELSITP